MAFSSSLFARRQSMRFQTYLPALDCTKTKDDDDVCDKWSNASTVASSVKRLSCNLPRPTESTSCFDSQQGPRKFSRPSININLVRENSMSLADSFTGSRQRLSEQFEGLVKLGEGSCAVVYRASTRKEHQEVALKVVRTDDEEQSQNARNEYTVLQQVNHPNIIKVLDFFTYVGGAVLVEEFFHGKNLETIVDEANYGCVAENIARQLFIQLIDAVAYLHKQGIIHRDVKPQNVLVSQTMTDLRLVDFNVSSLVNDGGGLTMTGTPAYMPPEVLKGNSPSEASDVWASGLCLHYMLMGDLPSKRGGIHVQLEGPKWELVSAPCKDMLRTCLEPHRDLRPPAHEVLLQSWSLLHF